MPGAGGGAAPGRPSALDLPGRRHRQPDTALGPRSRFRIGSVTKTFTAVLVLQCRDDGLLDLDDPLGRHLDVAGARRADRSAGCCRTPPGCSGSRTATSGTRCARRTCDELLADLVRVERVLPTGRRYHYSNLGMALLGQLVGAAARRHLGRGARRAGRSTPLGLADTSVDPGPQAVTGLPGRRVLRRGPSGAADRLRGGRAGRPAVEHRGGHGPVGGVPGRPGGPGPGRGGARPGHPGRDALAGDDHRRDGLEGRLRPRPDPGAAARTGWCTWGTTGRCPVSWPGSTVGAAVTARPARWAARCSPPRARRRRCRSCRTGCWPPPPSTTRRTSRRGVRDRAAPGPLRGVLGRWWGEGFEYVFSWHDGDAAGPGRGRSGGPAAGGLRADPGVAGRVPDRRRAGGRGAAAAHPGHRRDGGRVCTGPPTASPATRRPSTGTTSRA